MQYRPAQQQPPPQRRHSRSRSGSPGTNRFGTPPTGIPDGPWRTSSLVGSGGGPGPGELAAAQSIINRLSITGDAASSSSVQQQPRLTPLQKSQAQLPTLYTTRAQQTCVQGAPLVNLHRALQKYRVELDGVRHATSPKVTDIRSAYHAYAHDLVNELPIDHGFLPYFAAIYTEPIILASTAEPDQIYISSFYIIMNAYNHEFVASRADLKAAAILDSPQLEKDLHTVFIQGHNFTKAEIDACRVTLSGPIISPGDAQYILDKNFRSLTTTSPADPQKMTRLETFLTNTEIENNVFAKTFAESKGPMNIANHISFFVNFALLHRSLIFNPYTTGDKNIWARVPAAAFFKNKSIQDMVQARPPTKFPLPFAPMLYFINVVYSTFGPTIPFVWKAMAAFTQMETYHGHNIAEKADALAAEEAAAAAQASDDDDSDEFTDASSSRASSQHSIASAQVASPPKAAHVVPTPMQQTAAAEEDNETELELPVIQLHLFKETKFKSGPFPYLHYALQQNRKRLDKYLMPDTPPITTIRSAYRAYAHALVHGHKVSLGFLPYFAAITEPIVLEVATDPDLIYISSYYMLRQVYEHSYVRAPVNADLRKASDRDLVTLTAAFTEFERVCKFEHTFGIKTMCETPLIQAGHLRAVINHHVRPLYATDPANQAQVEELRRAMESPDMDEVYKRTFYRSKSPYGIYNHCSFFANTGLFIESLKRSPLLPEAHSKAFTVRGAYPDLFTSPTVQHAIIMYPHITFSMGIEVLYHINVIYKLFGDIPLVWEALHRFTANPVYLGSINIKERLDAIVPPFARAAYVLDNITEAGSVSSSYGQVVDKSFSLLNPALVPKPDAPQRQRTPIEHHPKPAAQEAIVIDEGDDEQPPPQRKQATPQHVARVSPLKQQQSSAGAGLAPMDDDSGAGAPAPLLCEIELRAATRLRDAIRRPKYNTHTRVIGLPTFATIKDAYLAYIHHLCKANSLDSRSTMPFFARIKESTPIKLTLVARPEDIYFSSFFFVANNVFSDDIAEFEVDGFTHIAQKNFDEEQPLLTGILFNPGDKDILFGTTLVTDEELYDNLDAGLEDVLKVHDLKPETLACALVEDFKKMTMGHFLADFSQQYGDEDAVAGHITETCEAVNAYLHAFYSYCFSEVPRAHIFYAHIRVPAAITFLNMAIQEILDASTDPLPVSRRPYPLQITLYAPYTFNLDEPEENEEEDEEEDEEKEPNFAAAVPDGTITPTVDEDVLVALLSKLWASFPDDAKAERIFVIAAVFFFTKIATFQGIDVVETYKTKNRRVLVA